MNMRVFAVSLLASVLTWGSDAQAVPVVTLNLGVPTVTATSAQIDVSITFDADDSSASINPNAGVTSIQLSVLGGGTSANVSGGDGGRFSFAPSSSLTNWFALDDSFPLFLPGAVTYVLDTSTFPGSALIDGTTTLIGVLSVNLSGLAAGEVVIVDLLGAGGDTVIARQDPIGDFDSETNVVVQGGVVTFQAVGGAAVPEPATFALGAIGVASLGLRRRRA